MWLVKFDTIYPINYNRLIFGELPASKKRIRFFEWLKVLIEPVKILHNDFLEYRKKVNYKLSHNSQVCYLQEVLNDAFDKQLKRIYIENGIFLQALYIYTPEEELPVYIGEQYIYTEEELIEGQDDFIVVVPIALKPTSPIALEGFLNDMKALVEEYKLASKTYSIKWIE